ncbi:hypothetical protein J5N97_029527 [Dioscorea zingiberensis]|uniref:WD repeat-containing protein 44 n=1 Tax=Dioscorea zingiberensis TaxID=325984 RepID=A0A9D5C0Z6_9LILI|nr:hypothetical protein J5N97_029527 [Dioscorea zingiberensis]
MSEKDKGNSAKSSSTSSPSCGNSPSSSELMKVRQHGKPYKELTGLCMCQEIQAHQGSIWTIKFSTDARYLASAGEDRVVHVWQALERNISGSSSLRRDPTQQCMAACGSPDPPPAFLGSQTSKRAARKGLGPFASSRRSLPDNIVMSETIFSLSDKPVCSFHGHLDDVLDLSWSQSQHLLSSSMDKTVRLWDMETGACLKLFAHNDYDGRLCQKGQLEIRNKKKKSHAKKVTGFQFAPGNASEVMITSADSQIRVFDGFDMIHKFRGFRNTSSQISASFTSDGKYVVCASEDSHVYVWKREGSRSPGFGGRSKGWATTRSHEHFPCRDVSVAIPWPGSGSCCRPQPPLSSSSLRQTDNNKQHQSTKYPLDHQGSSSALEDMFHSSRSHGHPPLPKKSFSEHALVCNEDLSCPSRSVSGIGSSSFASASPSLQAGASVSVASSSSPSTSWGWYSGSGSKASSCVVEEASAWGLVIVTAGLGGDIRIYQNFGLPVRLESHGTNLF